MQSQGYLKVETRDRRSVSVRRMQSEEDLTDHCWSEDGWGPWERKADDLCCCCRQVASIVSDSVWPHRWQPTRLPHPWDSPGKNTGVGCLLEIGNVQKEILFQCIIIHSECLTSKWRATCESQTSFSLSMVIIFYTFYWFWTCWKAGSLNYLFELCLSTYPLAILTWMLIMISYSVQDTLSFHQYPSPKIIVDHKQTSALN